MEIMDGLNLQDRRHGALPNMPGEYMYCSEQCAIADCAVQPDGLM
jgi:hypothetical protein